MEPFLEVKSTECWTLTPWLHPTIAKDNIIRITSVDMALGCSREHSSEFIPSVGISPVGLESLRENSAWARSACAARSLSLLLQG